MAPDLPVPDRRPSEGVALPVEAIQEHILVIRGHKVLLDSDLAELYGVETRALVQAVKRNVRRFPADFVFQLDADEFGALTSQTVISKGRGGRRTPPYAFTEQGVAMLSSVLRSERAADVNVAIMRAFVQLRRVAASHAAIVRKLDELEQRVGEHDTHLAAVFEAIRQLMEPPTKQQRRIGFE